VSSGHIAASAGSDDAKIAAKTVAVAYVSGDTGFGGFFFLRFVF
jgi:hypothetical protein